MVKIIVDNAKKNVQLDLSLKQILRSASEPQMGAVKLAKE